MDDERESHGPAFEPPHESESPPPVPGPPAVASLGRPGARLWAGVVRFRWVASTGVLVVAVLVAVVVFGGGGAGPAVSGKAAAARATDRVPKGPIVRNIPFDCGMSPVLLKRLVPGADKEEQTGADSDTCTWEAGEIAWSIGGGNRTLKVEVTKGGHEDGESVSAAIRSFSDHLAPDERASVGIDPGALKPVTGLGREAVLWHFTEADGPVFPGEDKPRKVMARSAGTTVLLWAGNVTARITYSGADYSDQDVLDVKKPKPKMLSRTVTRAAALSAATWVAHSMRLPVTAAPKIAAAPHHTLITDVPAACRLVSKSVLDGLSDYPVEPERERGYLFDEHTEDVDPDACEWHPAASLRVTLARVGRSRAGGAVRIARLRYLELYHAARDGRPDEPAGDYDPVRYFHALRGPGDQAFMHYENDTITGGGTGEVVFRVRNVLVRAEYRSVDEDTFTQDEALNVVYSVARRAAGRVHP